MKIPFSKASANGNDFIFILSEHLPKRCSINSLVRRLCDRHNGIGSDGLFIVWKHRSYDFKLDYYNSDGSWEALCANGSRCAVRFMYEIHKYKKNVVFLAGDGQHEASIVDEVLVSMKMNLPIYKSQLISPEGIAGYFVDTGADHFVSELEKADDDLILTDSKKVRYAADFSPKGINVNFYKLISKYKVEIHTYEKGIEKIMQSCASGSTAVIFHLYNKGLVKSPVETVSRGGSLLFTFDKQWKNIMTTGPAKIIFSGEVKL